jgi:hypothetical protein
METKTESKATLDLNALKTALLEGKLKPEELDAAFAQASASQPVAAAAAPRTFFTMLREAPVVRKGRSKNLAYAENEVTGMLWGEIVSKIEENGAGIDDAGLYHSIGDGSYHIISVFVKSDDIGKLDTFMDKFFASNGLKDVKIEKGLTPNWFNGQGVIRTYSFFLVPTSSGEVADKTPTPPAVVEQPAAPKAEETPAPTGAVAPHKREKTGATAK